MFFKVWFTDSTTFISNGNYKKPNWTNIPNKQIKAIAFTLPDGNFITLQNYEKFNHFCEATQDIYGSNKFTLRYQYIMGMKKDKVTSYRITLFQGNNNRYKLGDITRREYEFGKEYNNKPTKGWKKGIKI